MKILYLSKLGRTPNITIASYPAMWVDGNPPMIAVEVRLQLYIRSHDESVAEVPYYVDTTVYYPLSGSVEGEHDVLSVGIVERLNTACEGVGFPYRVGASKAPKIARLLEQEIDWYRDRVNGGRA